MVKRAVVLIALVFFPIRTAVAQDLQAQVTAMRAEIDELKQEVNALKQELHGPASADALPMVQAQVEEQAQTKVETSSKFPMKLFGSIVSSTFWNSGDANWLDLPNIVQTPAAGLPSGSFSSTLRQSRFGATLDGPAIGSLRSSGVVAFDFFGGVPNFATGQVMGLPRLLYAYMRLDGKRTAVEIGQDQMILAPKEPTSLASFSFPMFFRSGNLYLRVPQLRVERKLSDGPAGEIRLIGGIVAPIAGDLSSSGYVFVPPDLAGERSRMPGFQSRLSWTAGDDPAYDRPKFDLGLSGHYSREQFTTGGQPSWAAAFDFDANEGRFGTGGEIYTGRNLAQFGGSLAQFGKSVGGFVEGRFAATPKLSFNAGYGTDRLFDMTEFPAPLSRNASAFANGIYKFTPEFNGSLEYRWLGTTPVNAATRMNSHLNLTFAYSF